MPPYRTGRRRVRGAPYARGSRNRKERTLPKKYVAPVASIAKRVITHLTERKHLNINRDDLTVLAQHYYSLDPLQFMTVGTGDGQRIGSKISNCWAHLSFCYFHNSTNWNGSLLRVLVVKAEQQIANNASTWTNDIAPPINWPFLFANDYLLSSAPTIGHDYTVLADHTVKSERQYNTPNYGTPGVLRFWVKLGDTLQFQNETDGGVAYQKFRNIYVIVGTCPIGTIATDVIGALQFSGELYWRDA